MMKSAMILVEARGWRGATRPLVRVLNPLPSPAFRSASQPRVVPPHHTLYPFGYHEARQVRLVVAAWSARASDATDAGSVRRFRTRP